MAKRSFWVVIDTTRDTARGLRGQVVCFADRHVTWLALSAARRNAT